MTIVAYTVVSLSFGLTMMLLFRSCAAASAIRLTKALAESLLVAVVHVVLFLVGQRSGALLRFEDLQTAELYQQSNELVFMGLMAVVALRWTVSAFRRKESGAYDIARWSTVAALALASGINLFLMGVADGFLGVAHKWQAAAIPLFVAEFLFSYLGVMMGRRQMPLSPRRWTLLSAILVLAVALFSIVG